MSNHVIMSSVQLSISCLVHVEPCQTISSNIILPRLTMMFHTNSTTCQWALRGGKHQAPMYPASFPLCGHIIFSHISRSQWHYDVMYNCIHRLSARSASCATTSPWRFGQVWWTHGDRHTPWPLWPCVWAVPLSSCTSGASRCSVESWEAEFSLQLTSDMDRMDRIWITSRSSHKPHNSHNSHGVLFSGLSGYVTTRPCTSRNGQLLDLEKGPSPRLEISFKPWINPKNHWENWEIGNFFEIFFYILYNNCIRIFCGRFFYVFCRATTISTTPSVSIRPSAAAAWRFKGQACPKSWHSQISDIKNPLEVHG